MKTPKTTIAAASAPIGMTSASAAGRRRPACAGAMDDASDLADHALHEIVHLLERDLGLLVRGAGRDHGLAGVVLQRSLEEGVVALHHLRLDGVGVLARRRGHRLAI